MIPYHIDATFSKSDAELIIKTMEGMTKLMGGCIEFKYDPDNAETLAWDPEWPNGGIMFQNHMSGCW